MGADTFVLAGTIMGIMTGRSLAYYGLLPVWACVLMGLAIFGIGYWAARNYSCI